MTWLDHFHPSNIRVEIDLTKSVFLTLFVFVVVHSVLFFITQEGTGDVSGVEHLVLDKISTNEVVAASVMEEKKKEPKKKRKHIRPPDAPKRFKR